MNAVCSQFDFNAPRKPSVRLDGISRRSFVTQGRWGHAETKTKSERPQMSRKKSGTGGGKREIELKPSRRLEESSSLVLRNYWLKIGLSKHETALLTRMGRDHGWKFNPSASAARWLL